MSNSSDGLKLLLGKKRKHNSGSTLDVGNLGIVAYCWNSTVVQGEQMKSMQQLLNDSSPSSQLLREHDFALLKMLRMWVQATNLITVEIQQRIDEMEQLMADNPEIMEAAKKLAEEQVIAEQKEGLRVAAMALVEASKPQLVAVDCETHDFANAAKVLEAQCEQSPETPL